MRRPLALVVAVLLVLSGSAAFAQDAASKQAARERELLRRAQAAQKQAEEAKAAVEAERGKLEAQVKVLKSKESESAGEIARARQKGDALRAAVETLTRERDQLLKEKTDLAERLSRTEAGASRLSAELAVLVASKAGVDKALGEMTAARGELQQVLDNCQLKNRELRAVVEELMTKYRDVGFWDVLKRKEPFTGLRRAEIDNLLESVRDRAQDAEVAPAR